MLPNLDMSSPTLLPLLAAAYWAGILLHEMGHALAGSIASGVRILACGVGVRRPLLALRIFGIAVYFGWPPLGGLTVAVFRRLSVPRWSLVLFAAGGILANGLTAALIGLLWQRGLSGEFAALLFYVSVFFALTSAVPCNARLGGVPLQTDGGLIRDYARHGNLELEQPGQRLALGTAVHRLCRELGIASGSRAYALDLALHEAALGDPQTARERLAEEAHDRAGPDEIERLLEPLVRAQIAVAEQPDDLDEQLQGFREACRDDPVAAASITLLQTEAALDRGEPADEWVRRARQLSARAGQADLQAAAGALQLESEKPEDLADRIHRLLQAGRRSALPPLAGLRLAGRGARILAERRETEEARGLFGEARERLQETARHIPSEATRRRFLVRFSKSLRAAVDALDGDILDEEPPLFLETTADGSDRRGAGRRPRTWKRWASACTRALLLGLAVLVVVRLLDDRSPDREVSYPRLTDEARGILDAADRRIRPLREAALLVELVHCERLAPLWARHGVEPAALQKDINRRLQDHLEQGADPAAGEAQRAGAYIRGRAMGEAWQTEQPDVKPELLLLALLHDADGICCNVLTDLGVDLEAFRRDLSAMLGSSGERGS